ncbi:hypothetical protein PCANB_000718 [Pneumocystis canis]|nr:hypothetical protein PCANB_000718 [Pneumocystis canis]
MGKKRKFKQNDVDVQIDLDKRNDDRIIICKYECFLRSLQDLIEYVSCLEREDCIDEKEKKIHEITLYLADIIRDDPFLAEDLFVFQSSVEMESSKESDIPFLPEIKDSALLKQVFTHRSYAYATQSYNVSEKDVLKLHNERLEFLGDSYLNHAVTRLLFKAFPDAREGELSMMRSQLVGNTKAEKISRLYGFDKRLLLSESAESDNVRSLKKIVADVFESYIGGLVLDSYNGEKIAFKWISQLMKSDISLFQKKQKSSVELDKMAKQTLYNRIGREFGTDGQTRKKIEYIWIGGEGGNKDGYEYSCRIDGQEVGRGWGPNQKIAGIRSAMDALVVSSLSLNSDVLKVTDDDVYSVKNERPSLSSVMSSQSDSDVSESFMSSLDIAYIVIFRNRFSQGILGEPEALDKIVELLCRLVTLCLNRKKAVESKHFSHALNESVDAHIKHLDPSWCGYNPLHRNRGFYSLDASNKLKLLCCLVDWCLMSSEAVRSFIDENYKNSTSNDTKNALSVNPLGKDGKNRKLWLIEGNDTPFRVYRESKSRSGSIKWESIAGTADELRQYAQSLSNDSSSDAITLVPKILEQVCPRVEKAQIRRDKLEANRARLAALNIESTLIGMRTRGKRIKYTFTDDDDDSDAQISMFKHKNYFHSNNESVRYTASGRMIRRPKRGDYQNHQKIEMNNDSNYRSFENMNELSGNLMQKNNNYAGCKNECYSGSETETESFSLKVLLRYNPKKLVTR